MSRIVDNVVRFPRTKRPTPTVQPQQSPQAQAYRPSMGDRVIEWVWIITACLAPLAIPIMGIWAFIELLLIPFGRPAWHFFGLFALMVAINVFVGSYTPRSFGR